MSCNNVNIENFPLAVSSGALSPSYKEIYKFGNNPAVGNTLETIWSQGGIYAYPASASTMTVSSSSQMILQLEQVQELLQFLD